MSVELTSIGMESEITYFYTVKQELFIIKVYRELSAIPKI